MHNKRVQGKLVFYDLKADGEKVQVMADVATSGEDLRSFVALHNSVKIGDIVGVSGFPGGCSCTPLTATTIMVLSRDSWRSTQAILAGSVQAHQWQRGSAMTCS